MRKIFSLLLLLLLFTAACGCSNTETTDNTSQTAFTVVMPTDSTVNGYRREVSEASSVAPESSETEVGSSHSEPSEAVYYANINTKKFHLSTCYYAKNSTQENIYICRDRQELVDSGYTPCKKCSP